MTGPGWFGLAVVGFPLWLTIARGVRWLVKR